MPRTLPDYLGDGHPRVHEIATAVGKFTDGLIRDPAGTSVPCPELTEPPGDYEFSIRIHLNYDRYDRDAGDHWPPVITGYYVLACGREDGRWRLKTSPLLGHDQDGNITARPVVDLRDQHQGLQPLTMLRALLAGRLV